jgi:CheY-like chemotaxis protein
MLPQIDGFACIEALRQQEAGWSIPIIAVTAKNLTSDDRHRLNGAVEQILGGTEWPKFFWWKITK